MRKANINKPSSLAVTMLQIDAEQAGQRIDNFLIRVCKGVPKSHLYKAIRGGQVRVNKGRIGADYRLEAGDIVRVPPMRLPQTNEARAVPPGQFPVIYEDDALLVIDKPAGVAVHGGSGVSFGVIEQLRAARPQAPFLELAHRLDRETSGILILAKRRQTLVKLHDMLREANVLRHYQTLVMGDWVNDRQHLRQPLLKWLTASGERRVRVDPDGKPAHTIISLRKRYGRYSLLDVELKTGRTHQIRVHLTAEGFPIVGDDKYGPQEMPAQLTRLGFRRMFLHACRLEFAHPLTGAILRLQAELPAECQRLLDSLEKSA